MKRVGVFLGITCIGIILFVVLRLQPAEPPSIVFGLLSPTWPGQENEPRDELLRQGAGAVPGLIAAVEYRSLTESTVWRRLVTQLPIPLAQRLPKNQNYAYRRRSAAWMLGEMGPVASRAVPALERIRKSSMEPEIRVTAIIALAKIQPGNPVARSNLLAELHSKVQTSRYFVALELGAFHAPDPELVTALMGALLDSNGEVRANAAWSVAQWGPVCRAAAPRLRELLNDSYRHVPVNSAYALVRVDPEQAPAGVQTILRLLESGSALADSALPPLALALGPTATNAIPWLEDCLLRRGRGVSEEVALVSLWRIRRQATPEMLARLPQLGSPSAIRALGELGPLAAAAEPRLRELLTGNSVSQREAASEALRQIRAAMPDR